MPPQRRKVGEFIPEAVRTRKPLYQLGVILVSFLLLTFGGVLYTNWVQRDSERKWCDLMVTLDNSYQPNYSKLTGPGKAVADQIHRLRDEFRCG